MGTQGTPKRRATLDRVLKELNRIAPLIPAGSYRRGKGTCNDLDVIQLTEDGTIPEEVFEKMQALNFEILAKGKKIGRFLRKDGTQVDWYGTKHLTVGAMLIHLTGSAAFNVGMRATAKRKKMSFSENGLVDANKKLIASRSEEEVFNALGMSVPPPEVRDDFYKLYGEYKLQ